MKKRRFISVLLLTAVLLIGLTVLTSCGLFGSKDTIVPPTIKNVSMLKTYTDYETSKEYLFNKDTQNAMAVESGGTFIISIEYDNPKKYPISYLKINGEKLMPAQFESGSDKNKTKIKLTAPTTTLSAEETYEINSIFYTAGTETKKIKFNTEFDMNFKVKVNPSYTLTFNYQNADLRSTTKKPISDVTTGVSVKFNDLMSSHGVVDADYSAAVGMPTKEGGWIFEGWYTKPYGEGILVKATDKYYFWSNVTLFAHYTRIFEYQIVELPTPIVHEYSGYKVVSGNIVATSGTKTFTNGVIITKDKTRGKHPKLDIYDTIVDEKAVKKEDDTFEVTAVEYPVIKVGNKAFTDVNNILELRIGKYVEEIGYYGFNNCNKLKKVTFDPDSRLKYIGDYAFQSTKEMGTPGFSFTLPESVVYLGNFAFRYSGWSSTTNDGRNESILHIYPRYKFIGFGCFMNTGFNEVIFEPGCYFESQIGYVEGRANEEAAGWSAIKPELNRIGGNLFANCQNLKRVEFKKNNEQELAALNIIPDRAFDADRYNVSGLEAVIFNEGLEIIGNNAFYYQRKLIELNMPNSLKEIGIEAFYMCESVINIKFEFGSMLEVLHSKCFGNMANVDRVEITSAVFSRYGNGPFANCGRLKSIEFPNIYDVENVPRGFSEEENPDEVMPFHYYSDLMFGTFETGTDSGEGDEVKSSYSLPTRVFCQSAVMDKFQNVLVDGKEMYTGSGSNKVSTGRSTYFSVIFVNDISLILDYINPSRQTYEPETVKIALQPVYDVTQPTRQVGYSIVYWSHRSVEITLPSLSDFPTLAPQVPIIEIAMYALPTSVRKVVIPSSVTRLEHDAFNACSNLEDVVFQDRNTLKYIGDYAFFGTKITSFMGGSSLKVIGQNAFMRCRALRWVDLSQTAITNPIDGRLERLQTFKYQYELKDKDNKDTNDYSNTLYDGAFQGCVALSWVALPAGLRQLNTGLFTGCVALRTVILYSTSVNPSTNGTNNDTFYAKAMPSAIYDSAALPFMTIYVAAGTEITHQTILDPSWISAYVIIGAENVPAHP